MILFKDWNIQIPNGDRMLARQYDNLSRRLEVVGDLPEGWDWAMLMQAGKAMDIIPLAPMAGGVGAALTQEQLSIAGYYSLQLRGTQGDVVKHTNVICCYVADSLSGTDQWPTVPSEFLEVEHRIQELSEHPPVPGEDGFWRLWNPDTDTYESSEFPLPKGNSGSMLCAVKYVEQDLSETEQAQARININALGRDELSDAVDDALAQAKASGDFTGPAGPQGPKGDTGAVGAAGPQGPAPVRGEDYWTEEEQQSLRDEATNLISEELAKRGQLNPEFANNIEECTDTTKLYVLPDGNIYAYMTNKTEGYTNQISISTDTGGNIYNETGYKSASRCNSSGEVVDLDNMNATNPPFVTGFIPCKTGDVVRLKNCFIHAHGGDGTSDLGILYGGDGAFGIRCGLYDSSKSKIAVFSWGEVSNGTDMITYTDPGGDDFKLTEFTVAYSGTSHIRLTLAADGDPADAIVTVNEEITGEAGTENVWSNTGHAFVPADYEARIIAAEETVDLLKKAFAGDMAVYGIVDEENNILMTGTLAEGAYTLKYLHDDGTETAIGTFTMN